MSDKHLTASELDLYVEKGLEDDARLQIEGHLTNCARCRARLARDQRLSTALHTLPRDEPSRDLAVRIGAAAQAQVLQDQLRRSRMPFIVVATFFSLLLLLWFGFQMIVAFEDNGTLELLSILGGRPDLFSSYFIDSVWALIEALPLGEIVLTLFAMFTVIVLAEQWVDTIRPPRIAQLKKP